MIFLFILGSILCAFGGIAMVTYMHPASCDASWNQTKESFRATFSDRRFQISLGCFLSGTLLIILVICSF